MSRFSSLSSGLSSSDTVLMVFAELKTTFHDWLRWSMMFRSLTGLMEFWAWV